MAMQHRDGPEGIASPELTDVQRRLRESLLGVQNEVTMAPIALPNRNILRALLSATSHLTQELGSEDARRHEVREKLLAIIKDIERSS